MAEVGPGAHPAAGSPCCGGLSQVSERSPPQTTPQGWQGPLHHDGIWDNPDVLWLLLLQSHARDIYTLLPCMGTECPYTCRQWIQFYFSRTSFTSGPVALAGFGT